MKRLGKVSISVCYNVTKDYDEYTQSLYNNVHFTNKTIKYHLFCPNGKKKCKLCSNNKKKLRKTKHKSCFKDNI